MTEKSGQLHITSDIPFRFNVNIKLGEKSYHVQTEHGGTKEPLLTTRIYHKGEIVYSKKADRSDIMDEENYEDKLHTCCGRSKNLGQGKNLLCRFFQEAIQLTST